MLSIRSTHILPVNEAVELGGSIRYGATKTPGKALVSSNGPRTLMKENASTYTSRTGKGKRVMYPSTPGAGIEKIQPQRLFQDKGNASTMKPTSTILRVNPLLDKTNKTPYILRHQLPSTPLPIGPSKLNLLDHAVAGTPLSSLELLPSDSLTGITANVPMTLRPSSTRKSFRAPRSGSRSFETPDARGRKPHWDVSDGDISVELGHPGPSLEGIIMEEDDDEVEYAPPPVPEPSYDPGYYMPDYRELGAAIMAFGRWPRLGDEPIVDLSNLTCQAVEEISCPMPTRPEITDTAGLFPNRQPSAVASRKTVAGKQDRTSKLKIPAVGVSSRTPAPSIAPSASRPPTRMTATSKTGSRMTQLSRNGTTSSSAHASGSSSGPSTSSSRKVVERRPPQSTKLPSSTDRSAAKPQTSGKQGLVKTQGSSPPLKPVAGDRARTTSTRVPTTHRPATGPNAKGTMNLPAPLDDVQLGTDDDHDILSLQDDLLS